MFERGLGLSIPNVVGGGGGGGVDPDDDVVTCDPNGLTECEFFLETNARKAHYVIFS